MERCSYCNSRIIPISRDKTISKEDFSYYFKNILSTNIYHLDLSEQEDLDSDIIKELAHSENVGAVKFLDVSSTNVGYAGINELLRSSEFGSLVSDTPTYHRTLPGAVHTIKVEIANTKCLEQYKNKKFKYPLPLIRDFEITYGHRCMGEPYMKYGYKEIILLENGKELK